MPRVRDAIRLVERDGWRHARTKGSHRIYKHPSKPGIVVIAGHPGKDVPRSIWLAILRQAGIPED